MKQTKLPFNSLKQNKIQWWCSCNIICYTRVTKQRVATDVAWLSWNEWTLWVCEWFQFANDDDDDVATVRWLKKIPRVFYVQYSAGYRAFHRCWPLLQYTTRGRADGRNFWLMFVCGIIYSACCFDSCKSGPVRKELHHSEPYWCKLIE